MRIINLIVIMCFALLCKADSSANLFYSSGKIYVVVAVLLIIFAGIIVYLVRLDRKISKLEKEHEA